MAKKGVYKISGNSKPTVGKKEFYIVDQWYPATPLSDRNLAKVTWELFIKTDNGFRATNIKKKGVNHFTFGKNAYKYVYKIEGYLHEPEGNSPMSLIVYPQKNEEKKVKIEKDIKNVLLTYENGNTINKTLSYRDRLQATATCKGLEGEKIVFKLWEDDEIKNGHNNKNQFITKSPPIEVNKFGKAKWNFALNSTFISLANKREDDKSKHEYYVTAEFNGKILEDSQNVNVINPEYKIEQPQQLPQRPRRQPRGNSSPKPKQESPKASTRPNSPNNQPDKKGKILSIKLVDIHGKQFSKNPKFGDVIKLIIEGKDVVGQPYRLKIWEHDNTGEDDLLYNQEHTFKSDKQEVYIRLLDEYRTIGEIGNNSKNPDSGEYWTGNRQEIFAEVILLGIKSESQRIDIDLKEEPKKETHNVSPAKVEKQDTISSSCICKASNLILGNKVDCAFRKKVIKICKDLWGDGRKIEMANNLMVIMYFETAKTFSPSKQNSRGFTGLIQFGVDAASDLGTTTDDLKKMSAVKQLDYVKNYFMQSIFAGKINTLLDMYLAINYPAMIKNNKTSPNNILYSAPSIQYHTNYSFMKENGEYDNIIGEETINGKKIIKRGFANGNTYVWEVNKEMQDWYNNNKSNKWDGVCEDSKVQTENIKQNNDNKYIIILDPGHGVKPGNLGTQARKYKIKDDNKVYDVNTLPNNVLTNPSNYIIGNNEHPSGGFDNENTESNIVYDIALKMKEKIETYGHLVYITRSQRATINLSEEANFKKYLGGGATAGAAINFRSKMSSTLKADYFISIHCDGWNDFSKGAHTIYSDDDSKQLAIDLINKYDITNILSKSPHKRSDLGVLKSTNKAKKKVLIELGYLTSPIDAKNIINNKDKIATLLVNGLIKNINNG